MRYATFTPTGGGFRHLGAVLSDDRILDLTTSAPDDQTFGSMLAFIDAGAPASERASHAIQDAEAVGSAGLPVFPLESVRLEAPIPRPRKNIFCVGLNFPSHVEANALALGIRPEVGEVPLFFTKPTTAVIGPGEPIRLDERLTQKLDYEVELGIVIGRGGRWIDESTALDHVFGYTLVNDVSARDLQWRTSQMFYGKGLDTFAPIGPWIADRSEIGDGSDIELVCLVNGEERQRDSTKNLIFDAARIIAELSKGLTLEAGDIIATGTPGGCGYQLMPPSFLKVDDVVECNARGLGRLVNPVAAAERQPENRQVNAGAEAAR
jgi:2-keto-4-pentenoate hydratase/2-oxohepta-3-ene-1,7-dioic acid hydratase in catechol pathway